MSINAFLHAVVYGIRGRHTDHGDDPHSVNPPESATTSKLSARLFDVFARTYDLGFTSFGGPPVHFQIFHRRFVEDSGKTPWIDEQTYKELFAICQAFPGPGSTKMLFNIAQIHSGLLPALFVFLVWSLPGAIAMYGLSLGVQRINEVLPPPVYALLSGLNAATVGIICLAAVQLARKAITDNLTRILVVLGGCAGLCYNALWYFPVLIVMAGITTVTWDCWGRSLLRKLRKRAQPSITPEPLAETGMVIAMEPLSKYEEQTPQVVDNVMSHRHQAGSSSPEIEAVLRSKDDIVVTNTTEEEAAPQSSSDHAIHVKVGLCLIAFFFAIFTSLMIVRGVIHAPPLLLALFNNMFLAGTIIFGGGPVVIPLLREYVVQPGWVSPRDFLLGLAIIQALPGPNFNFAVYLGALAVAGPAGPKSVPSIVGAILGFIGIFAPGLWLSIGFQSIWRAFRKRQEVVSLLRGVNAAAVGFVFTAVYRLWEIGYLTTTANQGSSLGQEPWWLVVATVTFTAVEWFFIPPAIAILAGAVAGLAWWGAIGRGH